MAAARTFQDLVAWQLCSDLSVAISELTSTIDNETLRDQMRDAADSAPALIAEGFRRYTTPEFVRYLRMARGELGEIQSDLEVGYRKGQFASPNYERVTILARRAMGTTTNLLKAKLRQLEAEKLTRRKKRPSGRT